MSVKWREANDALNATDIYGRAVMPDPKKANALLDEIVGMISGEHESHIYDKDESVDTGDQPSTNVFSRIFDKLTGKEPQQKAEQKQEKVVSAPVREVKVIEKEEMTDEVRIQFVDQLMYARFVLDDVRAVPEPDKTASNAVKISKVRARAGEIKRDLSGVDQDLAVTDNVASIRGRVNEIVRKSERVAKELARLQEYKEDWLDQFKIFMIRAQEIAKAQDIEFDEAMKKKMKQKITILAKRREEITDLEGELEVIILDSI